MKNRRIAFLMASTGLLITAAFAQNKTTKPKQPAGKPVMEVVLGKSERNGGPISKAEYDRLAPQGIRIKSPQGAVIEGFSFTYGERNMYEDSAGNPLPVTEYLTEYCMGDSLSPYISQSISSRTKPGDTAYYDDIHIRMADGQPAAGKAMKFVITR